MENYAIELKNITKTFGSVVANKDVSLTVKQGEILALLGENGSGKTTLMNMLSGIYQPDNGSIFVYGEQVVIHSPEDSKNLGIGMIHQHFKLVDNFTAADNIWIGAQTPKYPLAAGFSSIKNTLATKKAPLNNAKKSVCEGAKKSDILLAKCKKGIKIGGLGAAYYATAAGLYSYEVIKAGLFAAKQQILTKNRYQKIADITTKFGFEMEPTKKIYEMAVSEKQTVEIVKVLYYGAKILILDEPTAVLTVQEIAKLFAVLRKMKDEGHAIIIITHKLNEVMDISDRVAIMRKGEYITTVNTAETNEQQLTEYMVGKKVELEIERPLTEFDKPLLEIRDLTIINDEGADAISGVNFYIRGGEILGVAGIAGCGQKELCEAIAGLRPIKSGSIIHKGDNIVGLKPQMIIKKGVSMSFIPEDRLGMGLAPSLSITDNMMLKSYQGNWYNPFVDRATAKTQAQNVIEELSIVTPSCKTPVRRLSGGNVQKVLVGREMMSGPNVIVTAYPVRGLDINSAYAIYDILNAQKKNGVGILFVGEDLDVMLALCDKILVLCHGKVMGIVHATKTDKEQLGLMMTGALDLTAVKKDKRLGIAKDTNVKEDSEGNKND